MYRLDRKSNTGDIYRGLAMSGKMTFGDDFYADFFGRENVCNKGRREANRPEINKRWPRALGIREYMPAYHCHYHETDNNKV